MKGLIQSGLIAISSLIVVAACAQPAPPPGRPGLPADVRPQVQQLQSINGKVLEYISNDRYEFDAFTFQQQTGTATVLFPPHAGADLMKSLPKGKEAGLTGFFDTTPEGARVFRLTGVSGNDNSIMLNNPPVDPAAPSGSPVSFSGTVTSVHRNRDSAMDGVLLDNKTLLELPPAAATQLTASITPGQKISGTGNNTPIPQGVVLNGIAGRIHPLTLTAGGNTFLIR